MRSKIEILGWKLQPVTLPKPTPFTRSHSLFGQRERNGVRLFDIDTLEKFKNLECFISENTHNFKTFVSNVQGYLLSKLFFLFLLYHLI